MNHLRESLRSLRSLGPRDAIKNAENDLALKVEFSKLKREDLERFSVRMRATLFILDIAL